MSGNPITVCKGPPKQFLVLVGDDDGAIRTALNTQLNTIEGVENCYYIQNYYYSAKFGIKSFSTLREVVEDFEANNSSMMCMFHAYKSMSYLKEAKDVADKIKADTRVVIVDSLETCPDAEQVETFANSNEFETVYMQPNEEQLLDAEEHMEKVGVDRLIETISVCNWPWRVINSFGIRSTANEEEVSNEHKIGEGDVLSGATADLLMQHYVHWFQTVTEPKLPAPQHAERVHLSADSPTTTEETTNQDDVSISVDIDLVCTKSQDEAKN
ncbi:unnamed protein product [Caenorhabditis nigoni]